jgi:uncharacterized protein (TIGR00251 family)
MTGPFQEHESGVLIHVWVVPGAHMQGLAGLHGERLKIRVSAPPEEGKANRAVARLLADHLDTEVELVRGMASRAKVFVASGIDIGTARSKLGV